MNEKMNEFFFAKIEGAVLGWLRIIFYLAVLMVFAPMPMEKLCIVPAELKTHSTVFGSLNEVFRSVSAFVPVLWIWKISLITSALGLLSRLSLPIAFVSTGIVFSLHNAYSCGFHGGNLFFLGMGILMLSSAGSYLSLDALFQKKRGMHSPDKISIWPIRLIQVNFLTMFFFAAITKLINLGFGYITRDEFYAIILTKKTWGGSFSDLFVFLLDRPFFTRFLGGFAFLIELLCPLVFLHKKLLAFFILSLALMQLMIYLNLGISSFNAMPAIYAFWIDWEAVFGFFRGRHEENKS